MKKAFHIYTVSDATGELANNLATSAVGQFPKIKVKVVRRPRISTDREISRVVAEAKKARGVILFTMVSHDVRRRVLSEAKREGVVAMDIMGPVLDMLSHYFHTLPSDEPGLQYKITRDYYKRTEAVDFAVRHDDGLGLETLNEADIVLLGISRTSKTPLSIYLAFQGYRCSNIPIVKGIPLPSPVFHIDSKKLVGLIISPDKLAGMRSTRLKKMGRPETEHYAQMEHISDELSYAREIFRTLGDMPVIDVTGKAIEEVAAEILHELKL